MQMNYFSVVNTKNVNAQAPMYENKIDADIKAKLLGDDYVVVENVLNCSIIELYCDMLGVDFNDIIDYEIMDVDKTAIMVRIKTDKIRYCFVGCNCKRVIVVPNTMFDSVKCINDMIGVPTESYYLDIDGTIEYDGGVCITEDKDIETYDIYINKKTNKKMETKKKLTRVEWLGNHYNSHITIMKSGFHWVTFKVDTDGRKLIAFYEHKKSVVPKQLLKYEIAENL